MPYREGVLPFLLCDSQFVIAGPSRRRTVNAKDIFHETLRLEKGELLTQIVTDKVYSEIPFDFVKRTKQERVDYPLLSIAAIKKDYKIRTAFSGLCAYPFRSKTIEDKLNDHELVINRVDTIVPLLPGPVLSDIQGSAEYREFVLMNTLPEILEKIIGK